MRGGINESNSQEHLAGELHRVRLLISDYMRKKEQQRRHGNEFLPEEILPLEMPFFKGSGGASVPLETMKIGYALFPGDCTEKEPLPVLKRCALSFSLSPEEYEVLVLCIAAEYDSEIRAALNGLSRRGGEHYPVVEAMVLMLEALDVERTEALRLFSASTLVRCNIIEISVIDHEMPFLSREVRLNPRIFNYIIHDGADSRPLFDGLVSYDDSEADYDSMFSSMAIEELCHVAERMRRNGSAEEKGIVVFIEGESGSGAPDAVRYIAGSAGLPVLTVDLPGALHEQVPLKELYYSLLIESRLTNCCLHFPYADAFLAAPETDRARVRFLRFLQSHNGPVFISSRERLQASEIQSMRPYCRLVLPLPSYSRRVELWRKYISASSYACGDVMLDEEILAGTYVFTAGKIKNVVDAAANDVLKESAGGLREHLHDLCRDHSLPGVGVSGRIIKGDKGLDDIIIPADIANQLREIINCMRYRHKVYDDWGFGKKHSAGRGLNILVSGPSGTGKTMAAQVLGRELGMYICKINLSSVVSKYIGETEKRLDEVFAGAERSSTILFFDEADALFGKRTEVKDANDRYANIETNYLLQRMEEYDGMVLLATNLADNIDDAFKRRMHFRINFPFPDAPSRKLLWKKCFTEETPLAGDIDYDFLAASFALSGGNIKNAALSAAFYAAGENSAVSMKHVIMAVRREYQKINRLCQKVEFGPYYDLVVS